MAMRSYSNQRNMRKPESMYLKLKVALPDNITPNVKTAIYNILTTTKFDKLPIQLTSFRSTLGMPKIPPREDGRPVRPHPVQVGFVRGFDAATDEFSVMIFGTMSERVKDIMNPMLEIVYSEANGELLGIARFNLISLGANNYSYDPNAEENKDEQNPRPQRQQRQYIPRDDGDDSDSYKRRNRRDNRGRGRKPYDDNGKSYHKHHDEDPSMGTMADVFNAAKDAAEEIVPEVGVDQAGPAEDVTIEQTVAPTETVEVQSDTTEPEEAKVNECAE